MHNTQSLIADQVQREQALNPLQSFIIQAPAGSGKTELLTQRYLILLARVENVPEEIIAITFTRKAAAEMRTRIITALQRAVDPTPPDAAHAKKTWILATAALQRSRISQWNLLEHPERLRIQTIDSLCASLTSQLPILSQFGSQPEITENASYLYTQATRTILAGLEKAAPWLVHLETLLLHLDNDHRKVEQLLIDMLACREQWLSHILAARNTNHPKEQLEIALANITRRNLLKIIHEFPSEVADELLILARFAATHVNNDSVLQCLAELHNLPDANLENYIVWKSLGCLLLTKDYQWRKKLTVDTGFPSGKNKKEKDFFSAMKQRMVTLLEKLNTFDTLRQHLQALLQSPPAIYNDDQWKIIEALVELLPILTAQLQLTFREQGKVDYVEVASCALKALGDADAPSDLALALDYQIHHLLIDEFQDTSAVHYQLIERLIAGWQPDDGRTLFLVGDPMQSIYRFRKAEVGLFLQAREQGMSSIKLIPLILLTNFRSEQGIVDWINNTFESILPKLEDIHCGAIPFSACYASKPLAKEPAVIPHILIDSTPLQEAETVVKIINEVITNDPQASIAILVKARNHLLDIIPALQAAKINYRAVEIETLIHRTFIKDLLALTKALLHPADRIAWLGILRAPWCGLTLADLHALVAPHPELTVLECLQLRDSLPLSPEGKQRLDRLIPLLLHRLKHKQRKSLRLWIEGAWLAIGGPACLSTSEELTDVNAFFDLLESLEQGGDIPDMSILEKNLEKTFVNTLAPQQANSIEIMTIHKAKGLEFDVVILPALHRTPRVDDHKLLMWMEQPTAQGIELLLAPIKSAANNADPVHQFLRQEESKKSYYEAGRLLYVAATRAKKGLHILVCLKSDASSDTGFKKPAANCLLSQLWQQFIPDIERYLEKTTNNNSVNILKNTQKNIPSKFQLQRFALSWIPPELPNGKSGLFPPDILAPNLHKQPDFSALVYQAAANKLTSIGTLIHRILKQISLQGMQHWTKEKIITRQTHWQYSLLQLGVNEEHLQESLQIIEQAILNTLADTRGRWILDNNHLAAKSEYPLTGIINTEIKRIIIDRTFIDTDGIRWIIDYKTTAHPDTEPENFLIAQQNRYREQLEIYGKIIRLMDSRPIRLGLYFPLLTQWHEWPLEA